MNESQPSQPASFELPTPVEPAKNPESDVRQAGVANPEISGGTTLPSAAPPIDPTQLAKPVDPAHTQIDDSQSSQASDPDDLAAHDLDVIEKEWVQKAKQIIDKTRNDPHQQQDQMSSFSAEYVKKRYGKDIKLES